MIADSHCHAWRRWPYDTKVPDPDHRGSIEALLYEMDTHGVERAAVVCARIGAGNGGNGYGNDDNNTYVSTFAQKHPDRISAWVDFDCVWRTEHHTPGAPKRLQAELEINRAKGFTHYVEARNDGWLLTDEGHACFELAAKLQVVASLSISPAWLSDLRTIAQLYPTLPFLIHHMGGISCNSPTYSSDVMELVKCAAVPNINLKISGFNYSSALKWNFPYNDSQELFRSIYAAFGETRLFWASDFPASRDLLTYTQAIEVLRMHCNFVPQTAMELILGDNLNRLLNYPIHVSA